ncbi:CYTH-like superfamily phosphatase [Candidatus Mancarchaeum acidiphilum]|uniref:CYTH-like superfamily phosphatase n=1 Tax=Candidatus Mancarchaeum acidiphilum TaxID=1920749 RepID=A0A218NME5_9ARCH|nr:class IV adenylate cyclase [Candidatus Mancarchaeum acidiphilum]ASI13634.1 CYTH-like superfamily phosphatase [Candidatus Mancarchaeum acidiphilum]
MIEIETKIDDINESEAREALNRLGAEFKGDKFYRRYIFDLGSNEGEDKFIRLRTDGNKSTITYKDRKGGTLANTEEIETGVEDFNAAAKILSAALPNLLYQESKRSLYNLEGVEISIDQWPKLPPLMEIEADSEEKVMETIKKLGIKGKAIGNIGWEKVYSMYGMDLNDFKILKF